MIRNGLPISYSALVRDLMLAGIISQPTPPAPWVMRWEYGPELFVVTSGAT